LKVGFSSLKQTDDKEVTGSAFRARISYINYCYMK